MDEAIQKANVLMEAFAWIQQFRGRLVVIKLGGSALEDPATVRSLLKDVAFMSVVGMRPVLIHGGGKSIDQAMKSAGIEPRKVAGRRYTDAATLDIVTRVLAGEICEGLVTDLNASGGKAQGLSYLTRNCLVGEKLVLKTEQGENIDLGFVGQVVDVDVEYLNHITAQGIIPVLPSVAVDRQGQRYNINADTAAAAVAKFLKSEKLIFLSDVPGIFRDRHNPATLCSQLTGKQCRDLIADGTIDSGMIPKVEAAMDALAAGVRKVHIIDGRMPHSILLEIYSNTGVGTEIVP